MLPLLPCLLQDKCKQPCSNIRKHVKSLFCRFPLLNVYFKSGQLMAEMEDLNTVFLPWVTFGPELLTFSVAVKISAVTTRRPT